MGALEKGGERKHIHPKKAPIRHPFPIEWAANIGPLDIGDPKRPPGDTFEAIQAKPHPTTAYQRAAALVSFFLLCLLRLAIRQDCQCAGVPESAVL